MITLPALGGSTVILCSINALFILMTLPWMYKNKDGRVEGHWRQKHNPTESKPICNILFYCSLIHFSLN